MMQEIIKAKLLLTRKAKSVLLILFRHQERIMSLYIRMQKAIFKMLLFPSLRQRHARHRVFLWLIRIIMHSTREIKKVLRELVDGEDKHNPLTDDDLVDALTAKGYKVARRTIAKYRAQLDIPKARLRREL